jgi:hypothetical protein
MCSVVERTAFITLTAVFTILYFLTVLYGSQSENSEKGELPDSSKMYCVRIGENSSENS